MGRFTFLSRKLNQLAGSQIKQNVPPVSRMPDCDFQPEPFSGITYEEARKIRAENINPALFTYYKKPLMIRQGHMQWLFDETGRRYLDFFAGIVTVSVGHCHPKVNAVAKKQIDTLWHTTNVYLHQNIHEYAKKLTDKLPGDLKVVYFTNSGSEASDLAILMARLHTGVYDVLSLRNPLEMSFGGPFLFGQDFNDVEPGDFVAPGNGYHGASPHVMGMTALSTFKHNIPTNFGFLHTMNPDPYRGPWGGRNCRDSPTQVQRSCDCPVGECKANDMYVDQLKDVLQYSAPKGRIGAFFAESIQGGGGTVQYPRNFLKSAFEIVRAHGGVCVSDEVQTGFGRTGTDFWGFQGHGIMPDIVIMAKGIGNGFPLGAVVTTPEIAASMGKALHFNTYGGNPIACAIGSAVLDVIEEENIQERAHVLGTYLIQELEKLRDEFEIVGDVRGKGLMVGVEMVTDKETKVPLEPEKMMDIWDDIREMGVLVGKGGLNGNVFRVKPPMCITKEDIDFFVSVFREVLEKHDR